MVREMAEKGVNLRTRFTGLILGAIGVTVVFHTGALLTSDARHLRAQTERAHQTAAQHLAHACREALVNRDDLAVINFFNELRTTGHFLEASCVDLNGKILLSSQSRRMGETWPPAERVPEKSGKTVSWAHGILRWIYSSPILWKGKQTATALVVYDGEKSNAEVRMFLIASARRAIPVTVLVLATGVLVAWASSLTLTKPILKLVNAVRRVARGDWTVRVPDRAPGELSELAREFNEMSRRLAELDRLKDQFVYTVSHDLRNPLSAIATSARMMRGEGLPVWTAPLLDSLESSVTRLGTMVNNMLDTARLGEGGLSFDCRPLAVQRLLSEVLELYKPLASSTKKQLSISCPPDFPIVWADEEKLQRILLNLLANAFKFTSDGDRIAVTMESLVAGSVQFSVSDTGRGISPERLSHLFEPFRSTKGVVGEAARPQGAGLGLSITKALVEGMGGRVTVESTLGRGSTFRFSLPVAPVAA